MSDLYNVIACLCKIKGISVYKLCKETGIQPSVLTDLKAGRKKGLSAITAQKIASYFGVSVGYLLGEEKEKPTVQDDGLSNEKQELINYIKSLPQEKVELLLQVAKSIK